MDPDPESGFAINPEVEFLRILGTYPMPHFFKVSRFFSFIKFKSSDPDPRHFDLIRIRGDPRIRTIMDHPDPAPDFFFSDFQDANKKRVLSHRFFFSFLLTEATFTRFTSSHN
jgi:hypothetical protein